MRHTCLICFLAPCPVAAVMSMQLRDPGDENTQFAVARWQQMRSNNKPTGRRVYLDLGANWANTLRLYRDIGDANEVKQGPWEVYAFEVSPYIVPYCDKYVAWLNGHGPKPPLTVPPSGSSPHLQKYAAHYGCPTAPGDKMRDCMWKYFEKPLDDLKMDTSLQVPAVIDKRLAEAAVPVSPGRPDRYTLIPAAVGASNGNLTISFVTPQQQIRGGVHSASGGHSLSVPQVDVATWLMKNFRDEDYIVVKSDVEGAEFSLLRSLLDHKGIGLIDVLALECHKTAGNCDELMKDLRSQDMQLKTEGHNYHGWDSSSKPEDYLPVDPRPR